MALDIAEIKQALPRRHRSKITPELIKDVEKLLDNPDFGEVYSKNLVTYASVLKEGRFRLIDFFNATAFVSHKMLGDTSIAAYQKVFPDKVKDMALRGVSNKDVHSYASMYNKTRLVTLIYSQTLIPDHIMYASVRHKAIATQATLLDHDNPHVAQKAADSLLNHLKAPVDTKMTLDIGTKDGGIISDLSTALANLSKQQRGMIIDGSVNAREIAHSTIVTAEEADYE